MEGAGAVELAQLVGVSRRQVLRYLKILGDHGYLQIRGGGNQKRYTLTMAAGEFVPLQVKGHRSRGLVPACEGQTLTIQGIPA